MDNTSANHILVIKLGALGDFIQALGPMAAIRARHENDHITLLTTKSFVQIAKNSRYFNDVWVDNRPKWYDIFGWFALRKKLDDGHFFRVYDLQNNDRTEFYLKLFTKKPEWVGAAKGASHRNISPERTAGLAFDGHVQTLALAGIKNISIDSLQWIKGDKSFDGLRKPYVLIVPGSAAKHPQKRWPLERYIDLCQRLGEDGYQPVLLGGEVEADILSAIHEHVPSCLNLAGQTSFEDIVSLARGAAGAIGNDTGPMHLIAPTGCPSIILFSKNSQPHRHAPKGKDVRPLQKDDLKDLMLEEVWRTFENQQTSSP